MKPLLVLLSVFLVSLLGIRLLGNNYDLAMAGIIALAATLFFTAAGHFVYAKGMEMMLPPVVPFRTKVVLATGVIELLAAIFLFIPAFTIITGWFLIAFFVMVLPANIYAAVNHVDYQRATSAGAGLRYLWFRIPLQLFFIAWTYFFVVCS
jgi:uncharacterized membrane protein